MSDMVKESIFFFLVFNQQKYKIELGNVIDQRLKLLESEDPVFREEIEEQFSDYVKRIIIDDITFNLAIPTEQAMEMLEVMDVPSYLEVK